MDVMTAAEAKDIGNAKAIDRINAPATNTPARTSQADALGQADFLKLLTTQLQQQDPFSPVDNTEMLAQMAQFSALAGTSEMNATLADIAAKLDALIAAQAPATPDTPIPQQETGA